MILTDVHFFSPVRWLQHRPYGQGADYPRTESLFYIFGCGIDPKCGKNAKKALCQLVLTIIIHRL